MRDVEAELDKQGAIAGLFLVALSLLIPSVSFAQSVKMTEKQALFSLFTLDVAQAQCEGIEPNRKASGWWAIGLLMKNDKAYYDEWKDTARNLVVTASKFPTFCEDVKNAYGPQNIHTDRLPWASSNVRGMLN